jgi:hypothetical protein
VASGVGEETAFSDSYLVGFVFMMLHLGFEGGIEAQRLLLGLTNMRRVYLLSMDEVTYTHRPELTSLQTGRLVGVLKSMHFQEEKGQSSPSCTLLYRVYIITKLVSRRLHENLPICKVLAEASNHDAFP